LDFLTETIKGEIFQNIFNKNSGFDLFSLYSDLFSRKFRSNSDFLLTIRISLSNVFKYEI